MTSSTDNPTSLVAELHRDVDRATTPLDVVHKGRLKCTIGCSSCCVDELTVFQVEADRIRHHHAALLASEEPHAKGACAFLDSRGACRIYEHRPYVCRTQGYPLRWLDEPDPDADDDDLIIERRDICPLNDEPGPPIEILPESQCWTLGPFESQLALSAIAIGGRRDDPRSTARPFPKNRADRDELGHRGDRLVSATQQISTSEMSKVKSFPASGWLASNRTESSASAATVTTAV